MFCEPYPNLIFFFFSSAAPQLLYYSHIPVFFFSIFLGIFVYYKKRTLDSLILLLISSTFSLWLFLSLMIWVRTDSRLLMSMWSFWYIFYVLIFIFGLYFIYVFIDKKDVSLKKKLVWSAFLLPIVFFTPTKYNLGIFDIPGCNAIAGKILLGYVYSVMLVFLIWTVFVIVNRYKKISDPTFKKQTLFVSIGIFLFLLDFLIASFSGIAETFIKSTVDSFAVEQYGYLGMLVFIGFIVYSIVQYRAFEIKVLAAKIFVVVLIAGIISEFFFIQSTINIIINGITLLVSLGFGYMLVKSVKLEVRRKEELQILSDKLGIANSKLHDLDKAKSEFISIASHQLRTPLTAIKGFVSLLLEGTYGEVAPTQRPALEKVYISNERLVQLVEDLLNISRMDAGRMEFDFQEAQIEDLVKEAVETLELSAKQKGLYLTWQKPEVAMPKVKIDITKIKEVISNMIDNAIKYTQKGGLTVKVEKGSFYHHNDKEQKNILRVIVSDTGIGMDKEEMDMIFNKFQRGREVSHYHTDGTGLGMYIGKKVVEEHKGRIWAESEGKGRGSRFILELPIN